MFKHPLRRHNDSELTGAAQQVQARDVLVSSSLRLLGFIPKSRRIGLKGRISSSINPSVIKNEPIKTTLIGHYCALLRIASW